MKWLIALGVLQTFGIWFRAGVAYKEYRSKFVSNQSRDNERQVSSSATEVIKKEPNA